MEMEFKDTGRRRRMVLIVLGLALAVSAGFGAFTLASKGAPAEQVAKKGVLVAARDIPARTTVSSDDVTIKQVPVTEALSQAYAGQGDVLGRVTSVPIYSGQQVTPNLFATADADSDFSILAPGELVTADSPDWRAIALDIPKDRAVGGEIKSGDHVDLVVSVQIDLLLPNADGTYSKCDVTTPSQFTCGKSTKITFQDVEVLKAMPDDDTYVFKVNLMQAEQISHIAEEGPDSFTMVLRPAEDTRTVDTSQYGTTDDRLIMTYLFPAPQWFDVTKLDQPPVPYGTPGPGAVPGTGGSTASPTPVPSGEPGASQEPGESPAASAEPTPEASAAP
jgi:Flp pilus assembly protein CpaB